MTLVSQQSVVRRARIRPVPPRPANTPIVDAKKWLGPHADEMARLYAMILLALPARSRRRRSRIVQVMSSQGSEGVSSIVLGLAVAAATIGGPVLSSATRVRRPCLTTGARASTTLWLAPLI